LIEDRSGEIELWHWNDGGSALQESAKRDPKALARAA
jgi:hypothetical protein